MANNLNQTTKKRKFDQVDHNDPTTAEVVTAALEAHDRLLTTCRALRANLIRTIATIRQANEASRRELLHVLHAARQRNIDLWVAGCPVDRWTGTVLERFAHQQTQRLDASEQSVAVLDRDTGRLDRQIRKLERSMAARFASRPDATRNGDGAGGEAGEAPAAWGGEVE
jgi:hypothetical protein